ncbi:uncharacterized protein LOC121019003 isoform X4 [Herpailurus yagouaroundi]|uniref:uncharacterized protein LOC121019003 isoform X4 n=1 Tax=Herpailurus yagouaroundi TaxID=1608482 RepID=UPI001AD71443|nr:uncharacterized protein LOC121019003 isoform X4 [Puma yagouaroundi]
MRNRAGLGVRKSRRERRVGAGLVEGRVLPRPLGWPDTEQLGAGAGAGASASAPVAAGGGGACGSEGGGSGAAGFLPLHYPWPTASLCRTRGCVTAERVAEAEPVLQTKEPGTGSSYQISVFAEVSWVRGGRLPDLAEKGRDSWRCGRRGPLQSNLRAQRGAQTYNPEIKSHVLF